LVASINRRPFNIVRLSMFRLLTQINYQYLDV
jgi:hypothetical protein